MLQKQKPVQIFDLRAFPSGIFKEVNQSILFVSSLLFFSFDFVPVITVPDYCKDEIRQSVTSKHVPVEPDDLRDMYLV